jgi:fructokinase
MTEPSRSVLVAGETLIDFIPGRPGSLRTVESFTRRAGGAPANVAVGLARLDEPPWFCSALGTDPFGDFLAATLAAEGVPDRFLTRVPEAKTTLAFVSHDADADREFAFYRTDTADVHLDTSVVPDTVLATVDFVVVGGVTLTVEPARTATFDLVDRARDHDCTVVFDPNQRPELWAEAVDPARTFARLLTSADVLKASREDFADMDIDPALTTAGDGPRGPHTVFETHGSNGATVRSGDDAPWGSGRWSHDGYEVTPEDTTGAGDAFLAGAVASLAAGSTPEETLAFANAVAALATTADGAMHALPTRTAVAEFRNR